jgi:hypothetical protein
MPKVKITIGARIEAGGRSSLGQRLLRIVRARGGNKQAWLIAHLERIAAEEEKALGFRQRAPRRGPGAL